MRCKALAVAAGLLVGCGGKGSGDGSSVGDGSGNDDSAGDDGGDAGSDGTDGDSSGSGSGGGGDDGATGGGDGPTLDPPSEVRCFGESEMQNIDCWGLFGDTWVMVLPDCQISALPDGDDPPTEVDPWGERPCDADEPAGWEDIRCWSFPYSEGPDGVLYRTTCYGKTGEVWVEVRPLCEIEDELTDAYTPVDDPWPWETCGTQSQGAAWDERRCYQRDDGGVCFGRLGTTWTTILNDCLPDLFLNERGYIELDPWPPAAFSKCQ